MPTDEIIVKFSDVFFEWSQNKPILNGAGFSVRRGSKITLMGQNGAGKSTIFQLITGEAKPGSGSVSANKDLTISLAKQVITKEDLELTLKEFFQKCFAEKIYDIDKKIADVLKIVNLQMHHNRKIGGLSGGQQARILLASALIQNPDLLLLDEQTNNLDKAGIEHLTKFIIDYPKTCLVINNK